MLTFLTGTDTVSKKEYIYEKISELVDNDKCIYLIVPEQSSFERDREFLFKYGEKKSNRIKVMGFTRLCAELLEYFGLRIKPEADEAARNVIMSLAVEDAGDCLDVYSGYAGKSTLIAGLLSEYCEIKQAGLTPEELGKVSAVLSGSLKRKASELAKIFSVYDARISDRFSEQTDNIRIVTEQLKTNRYFDGAYFFFDDFRGFTGVQLLLIEQILAQAEQCFVSLTLPEDNIAASGGAFVHTLKNRHRLLSVANKKNISNGTFCTDNGQLPPPLGILRESLFDYGSVVTGEPTDRITLFSAVDKYGECDFVAMEIRRLLEEENYRCRDVAVFERGTGYAPAMISALKKYGIPVFADKRVPLSDYPLVRMILCAVRIAAFGFSSEDIFMLIKTDIAGIDEDECALLEGYVYLWQKDNGDWLREFTDNPDGFGVEVTSASTEKLARINAVRASVIAPLLRLKSSLEGNNGCDPCRAVFEYISSVKADKNFCDYAEYLNSHGNRDEAVRCAAVWDRVMESLDALHEALNGRSVSPRRFFELLKIIVSAGDIGRIPAGCDEIVIGTAGRTRFQNPRAVFVLGANSGVFPASATVNGLFSAKERRELCENNFILDNIPENIFAEEQCIAYTTLNCATERLYISYSKSTVKGEALECSSIVDEILRLFPKCAKKTSADIEPEDRIGSMAVAFEEYARSYGTNTSFEASLKECISADGEWGGKIAALERAAGKVPSLFDDAELATELFGKNMRLSASRVESYHKCPFMYFCRYGIGIAKRTHAGFDQRIIGLLVHHVLEKMLGEHSGDELVNMDEQRLKSETVRYAEAYITENMGGRENKSRSFNRSLDRIENEIFDILLRLIEGYGVSRFETRDVELEISENGHVKPYELELSDGGRMTVIGFVDRVDVMEDPDKTYLRIIDYKTGGKDFKLSDVFDGLNMQMLIYLMCLWDNAGSRYGDIVPAGVLYVPAKNGGDKLNDRHATAEQLHKQKMKNGVMQGIVLEDEYVLRGMESAAAGEYIKPKINEKGQLKGTFISYEDFVRLHKKIDSVLVETGDLLHKGFIPVMPVLNGDYKHTCEYCDYGDVCLREDCDPFKELAGLKHDDALKKLKAEVTDNV